MSKKCHHGLKLKNPWDNIHSITAHYIDIDGSSVDYSKLITVHRCWNCSEWLSLGPANDVSPEVQLEIEAARWAPRGDFGWHGFRSLGACSPDAQHADIFVREGRLADLREYEIGLLAAEIADGEQP